MPSISRRLLLAGGSALLALPARGGTEAAIPFQPWSRGELHIHHIDTGRGNATFILGPDGTTMLVDCGASRDGPEVSAPPRPDGSRSPGEWVARYALEHARAAGRDSMDYLIATHLHPDHIGDPPEGGAASEGFVPTGVSDVDRLMPSAVVIDRSYPDYGRLPPPNAPFTANYLAWLDARRRGGRRVEAVRVGSDRQISLRSPRAFPGFSVRALAANGRVWTGQGEASRDLFPDIAGLAPEDRPTENMCSVALRIGYGKFGYFTGGDLVADTRDGAFPWMDVESPAARAAGRVEVAAADHHGYFDACGPDFVRALDARAYVIPGWHVTHPGQMQLQRLLGAWRGKAQRDVFALEMLPENRLVNARFANQLRSTQGHVVVKVAPGGDSYRILVLDSGRDRGGVLFESASYLCRG